MRGFELGAALVAALCFGGVVGCGSAVRSELGVELEYGSVDDAAMTDFVLVELARETGLPFVAVFVYPIWVERTEDCWREGTALVCGSFKVVGGVARLRVAWAGGDCFADSLAHELLHWLLWASDSRWSDHEAREWEKLPIVQARAWELCTK